ncbi:MAG: hypothetical protein ABSE50_05150, partial [Xanthobacteraceae bacterium]
DIDANGDIQAANFPVFGFSDTDKATLKVDRGTDGALKAVLRGDVYDGRNFVKSILGGGDTGDQKSSRQPDSDLDLEVKLGAIIGFNGEAIRGLDLRYSRRGGHVRAFSLNGKLGETPLIGDMRGKSSGHQVIYFETKDAGALFRFTDTYAHMHGGEMWAAMDPPTAEQTPQDGILNIRDFAVRGEPQLDRIIAGVPSSPHGGAEFSRLRVEFTRSPGKLAIRDGVVRGPVIGATIDGQLDYANSDVHLRGTFVPLYGLNNAFGQIPIVGLFLGNGSNEGLFGITYEVVGPPGKSILRVNPISAVAPGLLRKLFEFPSVSADHFPSPDMSR